MVILAALPGMVRQLLVTGDLAKPGNFSAIVNSLGYRIRKIGLVCRVLFCQLANAAPATAAAADGRIGWSGEAETLRPISSTIIIEEVSGSIDEGAKGRGGPAVTRPGLPQIWFGGRESPCQWAPPAPIPPERSGNAYHQPYWGRLRVLDYDFLRSDPREAASVALRFTLGVPGVHTLIVGTTKPGRWRENAALLDAGPLPRAQFEAIRSRWHEVADASWVGQI